MAKTQTGTVRRRQARAGLLYSKERRGKVSAFFVINLLILLGFGLVMLFSASYATGYYRHGGDSYYFIRPQCLYAVAGLVLMAAISFVDYHFLRQWVRAVYVIALVLLVVVLFMEPINDCRRWINIKGLPTLQVGELAKFALILTTAYLMELYRKQLHRLKYGILYIIAPFIPYAVLLQKEPHYSAIILMALVLVTMMLCGGTALKWFTVLGGIAAGGAALMIAFQPDYVQTRLEGWTPFSHDTSKMVYQTRQSIYTIGSGGVWGVGIGNSRQKHLWLPESTNDFIFSVLCEELGFVGACLCIGLFVALIIQGIRIALKAPDLFGSLLCIGIVAQIGWQAMLNIAVVTNTVPNTGISLPFFSSGGTSLLVLLCEIGVMLSISRAVNRQAEDEKLQKAEQERLEERRLANQRFLQGF